mmetsp:Transcript_17044/g.68698  ORF Transcript_17044/g.68698 Transcript_17044/m.68698 type:complete len:303 (-) Transcript_17044:139-1047(-)
MPLLSGMSAKMKSLTSRRSAPDDATQTTGDVELGGGPPEAEAEAVDFDEDSKEEPSTVVPIEAVVVAGSVQVVPSTPEEAPDADDDRGTTPAALPTATAADPEQTAVPLTPRAASTIPQAAVTVQGTVVERIKESPRTTCAGAGCCVALLVFLLAFLLIPRNPSVRVERLDFFDIADPDSGDPGVLAVSDTVGATLALRFSSQSLTDAEWRDLDVDLEWLVDNSAVDVAAFERKASFSTGAYGSKTVRPDADEVLDEGMMLALRVRCETEGEAPLRIRGHIRGDDGTRFRIQSDWRDVSCSS